MKWVSWVFLYRESCHNGSGQMRWMRMRTENCRGCRSTTEICMRMEAKTGFEKLLGSINSLHKSSPHNSVPQGIRFFLLDSVILYKRNSKSCVAAKNIHLYFAFHILFTQDSLHISMCFSYNWKKYK